MPKRRDARLPFASLEALVEQKIPRALLAVWKLYLIRNPALNRLWGQDQQENFKLKMIILALYKDLFAVGYERLVSSINVGFRFSSKSLRHNTKIIRNLLSQWARKQVINEEKQSWDEERVKLPRRKGFHDVNLIIDSSDFRRSGKQSASTKDSNWSYKLNGPGQRYMILIDARGVVQKVWGGYSPKVYDGDMLKIIAGELLSCFDGAHILGDTHFELGNRIMSEIDPHPTVKFYTPYAEQRGRKRKRSPEDEEATLGVSVLTKVQKSWNTNAAHLRARVESPFGRMKIRWESLGSVFFENDREQNKVVLIAIGVHNWMIRHPTSK